MPTYRVQVADVYTVDVEAESEDEAAELAKDGNEVSNYDEQRILAIQRLSEDE
jgi:hypothetical protein